MPYHTSVLLKEAVDFLNVDSKGIYLDATLGDGGYSLEIIKRGGSVIGIDQDQESLDRAVKRFGELKIDPGKYSLVKANFRNLDRCVGEKVDGVVFDLGVSSNQLDEGTRGFSFLQDADLDMRMDRSLGVKASDLINGLNKGELERLFWEYGEFGNKRAAEVVIALRSKHRITTTRQLAEVLEKSVGRVRGKIHPATLVFQALRIAVNDELNSLKEALPKALTRLKAGGRIAAVSFHSLEDRIVKQQFKDFAGNGLGMVLTEKPVEPGREEMEANVRSRSAKLRVFEKHE